MEREELLSPFLLDLLEAPAPSGYEDAVRAVLEKHVRPVSREWESDALGNRFARIGSGSGLRVMVSGHMDELGFIIRYINPQGFLHFDVLGGHDIPLIPGRRVWILGGGGMVPGVIGKRAIHLQSANERKRLPEVHEMWIDIGVDSEKAAAERVRVGDPAVYDTGFSWMAGTRATARGFDNKLGTYVANEVLRRIAGSGDSLSGCLIALSTTMEEIGTRGAIPSVERERPDVAIVVEVGHATDIPDADLRKTGKYSLGAGPILCRGPNFHPALFELLVAEAERLQIPYQIKAEPRPAGNDARSIQIGAKGVATAVVAVPLRYMHTACEVVDLGDVEHSVRLIESVVRQLGSGDGDFCVEV